MADNPISSRAEDKLDRGPFVDALAHTIRSIDPSQGAVLGLLGAWGTGKSSVLNMLRETLGQEPALATIRFEPWLFTGANELVSVFFAHASAELGDRVSDSSGKKIAKLFDEYGQSLAVLKWVPLAGTWLDRFGSIAGVVAKWRKGRSVKAAELNRRRERLTELLRNRADPIVVIIDEIDRLLPNEVRDIFTLVRLTASFPNLIYVLAFDRGKVTQMLGQLGIDGSGYLEKIIQLPLDLPAVSRRSLDAALADGLARLRAELPAGPFYLEQWEQVYPAVLRPLFEDLRDVNRFLLALPPALTAVGREVAFVDMVALEAVRLLQPDVHAELAFRADLLTNLSAAGDVRADAAAHLESIVSAVPDEQPQARKAVRALCHLLFPATERYVGGDHYGAGDARRWRAKHRVASRTVFDIYLARALGPQATPADFLDRVRDGLTDELGLRSLLDTLPDDQLEDVLIRIEGMERDEVPDEPGTAVRVLSTLYPRLAGMPRSPSPLEMRISPERSNDRAIARMVECIQDEKGRTRVVREAFDTAPSLYGRMRLLYAVAQHGPARPALIDETEAEDLQSILWSLVRHSTIAQLAGEPRLLALLRRALQDEPDDRSVIDEHLKEPQVIAALLRDPGTVTAIADYSGRPLVSVFGGISELRTHLERFAARADSTLLQDPEIIRVLGRVKGFLESEPPVPEWARRKVEFAASSCAPRHLFEPRDETTLLVLRAASLHQVSPQRSGDAALNTGGFQDAFAGFLSDAEAFRAAAGYCERHGLVGASPDTVPEAVEMGPRYIVLQRQLTGPGTEVTLTARIAISMPGAADPVVRVLADLCVGSSAAAGQSTSPLLSLIEVRDMLAELLATTNAVATAYLPEFLGEPTLPHEASEIHIACPGRAHQAGTRPQANIGDVIDLEVLGQRSESSSLRDGEYRAGAAYPIDNPADRTDLVNHALLSMAGPLWAFRHPDRQLVELLQSQEDDVPEPWLA